jgi:hypothetical protein
MQGHAQSAGSFFFGPNVGVGSNSTQGTFVRVGLDVGMYYDENIYGGIGGYYAMGQRPDDDREIGVGPFIGYVYPMFSFLSGQLREDIDYVDERNPMIQSGTSDTYTYTTSYGMMSSTYAGVHLKFTNNFGFSVGYRLAVGLSNSSLADGRSGFVLGFLIGI